MGSRTERSIKNASLGVGVQICSLLFFFITRTTLILGLGEYYLGLNSVMTGLIAVFSLAELGLTNAIMYSLYKPLSENDNQKIEAYMTLFKKIYRAIGITILIISIIAIPILPNLINSEITTEVYIIYSLFVANTVLSYLFFNYRSCLMQANQEKYLVSLSDLVFVSLSSIGQIVAFLFFHNYILGLVFLVIAQTIRSFTLLVISKYKYPAFNYSAKTKLTKNEKVTLAKNIYAMAIGKFSNAASNSLPNVIIAAIVGLAQSGIYSNYQMIVAGVELLMTQLFGSLTASVGNLNIESTAKSKELTFDRIGFASFWIYGTCAVCLWTSLNPFIYAWIGKAYLLTNSCVLGLVFNFLTIGLLRSSTVFRQGCGLFYQGRHRPLASCILTICFSLTLVNYFGIAGVIWSPVLSRIIVTSWYDPWLVHKYVLDKKPYKFYKQTLAYLVACILALITCGFICNFVFGETWLFVIQNVALSVFITQLIFFALFRKNPSFDYFKNLILFRLFKK